MSAFVRLLCRIFEHEKIDGDGRVDRYLDRWTLHGNDEGKWYLHRFTGDDWSVDLHDHPKDFTVFGLWGGYIEETPPLRNGSPLLMQFGAGVTDQPVADCLQESYRAPFFRKFPAEHIHRLRLPDGTRSCWTLVHVGKSRRQWGWWTPLGWMPWREYVFGPYSDTRVRR